MIFIIAVFQSLFAEYLQLTVRHRVYQSSLFYDIWSNSLRMSITWEAQGSEVNQPHRKVHLRKVKVMKFMRGDKIPIIYLP